MNFLFKDEQSLTPGEYGIRKGLKAGLITAPYGMSYGALKSGGSPALSGAIVGLGTATLVALAQAAIRKYRDVDPEMAQPVTIPGHAVPLRTGVGSFTQGFENVRSAY